ncbi:MAG: AtpZ/AtpI family protein [Candidatus Fonsibacter sp.]
MFDLEELKKKLSQKKNLKEEKLSPKNTQLGIAFKIGTELVAAVFVATLIGWYLDKWLNTKPFFLIAFIILGIIAGIFNVVRSAKMINKG